VTHGGNTTRMLQGETRKPATTFNRSANIRTRLSAPNSMMTRVR
jgi:hypothetical protein